MFKSLRRFIFLIIIIGLSLLAIKAANIYRINAYPLSGHLINSAIKGEVVIIRDQHGVTHITTKKCDQDAIYALGFAQAEDRIWQMDILRRTAEGSLSEILGPKALAADKFMRTLGFAQRSQASYQHFDQRTKTFLKAYSAGVNAYLARQHLPIPFKLLSYQPKPWQPVDSLVIARLMSLNLNGQWRLKLIYATLAKQFSPEQLKQLFPAYPSKAPTILNQQDLQQSGLIGQQALSQQSPAALNLKRETTYMPDGLNKQSGLGSNSWVISGKLSQTGKPILANDPHLGLQQPALWYLIELHGPHLHVIGASIPGLPAVIIGHNNTIAWGLTNVEPDAQEIYIETKDAPIKRQHEKIQIKNQAPLDFVVKTINGRPVLNGALNDLAATPLLSLKWTGLGRKDTTMQSFIKLDYASNWLSFKTALGDFIAPAQHLVYADTNGNIGYYLAGKIPQRNGWYSLGPVVDNAKHQWQGFIPFAKLPHVYNPQKGYIVTANNKAAGQHYPWPITHYRTREAYRAERITDQVKHLIPLNMAKNQQLQNDVKSYLWRDLKKRLLKTKALDKNSRHALKILTNWNGDMDRQQIAPTIFAYWYRQFIQLLLPKTLDNFDMDHGQFIDAQLQHPTLFCQQTFCKTSQAFLSHTLQKAMQELVKNRGENAKQWRWGILHQAQFYDSILSKQALLRPFFGEQIASSGGRNTVNVGYYNLQQFKHTKGAAYRQIIDLNDLNKSVFINAPGQSENYFSQHHHDLLYAWQQGHYIAMSNTLKSMGRSQILILHPPNGEKHASKN